MQERTVCAPGNIKKLVTMLNKIKNINGVDEDKAVLLGQAAEEAESHVKEVVAK